MILDLSTSTDLQIHFDPVGSSEQLDAVAFDIEVLFRTSFQQTKIEMKGSWLFHESLNTFQQELSSLIHKTTGRAALVEMSGLPILSIERNANSILTHIQTTDTMDNGRATVAVSGNFDEISVLLEKLRGYPKWW